MKKFLVTLTLVAAANAFADQEVRKCRPPGLNSRSGDAKIMVICEGYDKGHFLADDEKLIKIEIRAFANNTRAGQYLPGVLQIENPQSIIRDYAIALSWYGSQILSGEINDSSQIKNADYKDEVQEILMALRNANVATASVKGNLEITSLDIPVGASLYLTPDKKNGTAPFSTITNEEMEATAREQARKDQQAQRTTHLQNRFKVTITGDSMELNLSALESFLNKEGPLKLRCKLEVQGNDLVRLAISHSSGSSFVYGAAIDVYLREFNLTRQECEAGVEITLIKGKRN